MENIPKVPETIEEAVKALTSEHDENKAIEYLRLHPEDTQEFCLQTIETYSPGDKMGQMKLATIIERLLKNSK